MGSADGKVLQVFVCCKKQKKQKCNNTKTQIAKMQTNITVVVGQQLWSRCGWVGGGVQWRGWVVGGGG